MGRQAYLVGEDDYAFEWMKEAMRRHQTEVTEPSVPLSDVLQFYAFSSYKQGIISTPFNMISICACYMAMLIYFVIHIQVNTKWRPKLQPN